MEIILYICNVIQGGGSHDGRGPQRPSLTGTENISVDIGDYLQNSRRISATPSENIAAKLGKQHSAAAEVFQTDVNLEPNTMFRRHTREAKVLLSTLAVSPTLPATGMGRIAKLSINSKLQIFKS